MPKPVLFFKALPPAQPVILFFKGFIASYIRNGKLVAGHYRKGGKAVPVAMGQITLFDDPEKPSKKVENEPTSSNLSTIIPDTSNQKGKDMALSEEKEPTREPRTAPLDASYWAKLLASGVPDAELSKQMKDAGLDIPARTAIWEQIKPRQAPAPRQIIAKKDPNQKFKDAAQQILQSKKSTDREREFLESMANAQFSLSVKQKQWLKKIADRVDVKLEYSSRPTANPIYNNPYRPPEHMDLPTWDKEAQRWYDAEY